MPRAHRHYIPGYVWHITHRCHKQEFLLRFEKVRTFILHGIQISPDKNVNFPCAAAPFTVSPVPWASTCVLPYPGTRPYMTFLFVSSQVRSLLHRLPALRLPSDPASRWRPCLRLVIFLRFTTLHRNTYRGLEPHEFTPMPDVHKALKDKRARRFFEVHHFCQCHM